MKEINQVILYLPQLLIYLVPGFVLIYTFKFLRGDSNKKDEKVRMLYSIIVSYILISFYSEIMSIEGVDILIQDVYKNASILTIMAVIIAYVLYSILKIPYITQLLSRIGIRVGMHIDILDEIFDDEEGIWVYLFMSDVTYLGKLIKYENIKDNNKDTYVILKNYTVYDKDTAQVMKDNSQVNDHLAMINMKNVLRLETVYSNNSSVLKRILK